MFLAPMNQEPPQQPPQRCECMDGCGWMLGLLMLPGFVVSLYQVLVLLGLVRDAVMTEKFGVLLLAGCAAWCLTLLFSGPERRPLGWLLLAAFVLTGASFFFMLPLKLPRLPDGTLLLVLALAGVGAFAVLALRVLAGKWGR